MIREEREYFVCKTQTPSKRTPHFRKVSQIVILIMYLMSLGPYLITKPRKGPTPTTMSGAMLI